MMYTATDTIMIMTEDMTEGMTIDTTGDMTETFMTL